MTSAPSAQDLSSLPADFLAADIHQRLFNASVAFIVATAVVGILFTISRIRFAERNHWEIWILYPISYTLQLLLGVICILFVRYGGAGRHVQYWELHDPGAITNFLKIQTADEFIYVAGVTFPKLCILMMYLRIFIDKMTQIATKVVIVFVLLTWISVGIITTFTICIPFAYKWDKSIPGGHCADLIASYRWVSVPNILIDLAIIFLPVPNLYRLQMTRIRKIGIFLTFLTGGLGIITAILRFVGFLTVDLESDVTYLGVTTQIYTLVEPNAYFICSCLPGMRPLLRAMFHKFQGNMKSGYGQTSSEQHSITLDVPRGSYKASVSIPQNSRPGSSHYDDVALIRMDKSYRVEYGRSS